MNFRLLLVTLLWLFGHAMGSASHPGVDGFLATSSQHQTAAWTQGFRTLEDANQFIVELRMHLLREGNTQKPNEKRDLLLLKESRLEGSGCDPAPDQAAVVREIFAVNGLETPQCICVNFAECDVSGNITDLMLQNRNLRVLPDSIGNLTWLLSLDLSVNQLKVIPESVGKLKRLVYLEIWSNLLTFLPSSIGSLTQLSKLLASNNLLVMLPDSIGNLSQLTELDAASNSLVALPDTLGGMVSLEQLSLGGNTIRTLPESIGNLTGLTRLDVSRNKLVSLPNTLCNLSSLNFLSLVTNDLGALPDCIGHLSQVTQMLLDVNRLVSIPNSIGNLTRLTELSITRNQLTVLPNSIERLVALTQLTGAFNQLQSVPLRLPPKVSQLVLRGNQITTIPDSIGLFTSLRTIDLSVNLIESIPSSIGNLSKLSSLDISSNRLQAMPDTGCNLRALTYLALSFNALSKLPECLGNLTLLNSLAVTNCFLTALPNSLGAMKLLDSLRLSSNLITHLPNSMSNLTSLRQLELSNNLLISLPDCFTAMTALASLDVSSNLLTSLPASMANLVSLTLLDVSNNSLSTIPDWIGQLTELVELDAMSNELVNVSDSVGDLGQLKILALSKNLLTWVPALLGKLGLLQSLLLSHNRLSSIPSEFRNLTQLNELRIRNNSLTGLPDNLLFDLKLLQIADLAHNQLTLIPAASELPCNLNSMDLSSNQIMGFEDSGGVSSYCYRSKINLGSNMLGQYLGINDAFDTLIDLLNPSDLSLSNNSLSGELFTRNPNPRLITLDLSDNNLQVDSASISSLVADTKSSLVNLRGNPNLTLDKSLLDFLEATDLDPQNFFPTESVLCQKAKLAGTQGIQLYLNPPQRHFAQCICQDAMRGSHMIWNPSQGNCATLPDSTASAVLFDSLINVSAARIAVAPGFYPTAFFSEPNSSKWDLSTLQLVTCHFAPACRSAIPDNQLADFVGDLLKAPPDFQCAPGYDDFMCSRCVPGYFAVETQCFECFTASSVIVPIITAAVALTVLVGLWSSNESSNGSVAADLCFFFLQLLHILPFSASTLAHRFESTSSSVLSLLYFRLFAADCIDPSLDATSRPLVSLIVVLAIPFVCWVAATLSYCHRACKAAEEDRDGIWSECKHQAFEFGWTLVELVYFPVADSVITTFNCTQQAGFTFLTYAPYIDCTSSTYSQMWNISVALLVIFVAPFPLVSVFRYRRAGKDQELPMIRDPYRLWWWMPVIYTGRALYLSLFVGLLHWNSPWLAPAVFLMLLVSLVSVLELKPYKNRWENYLEAAILVAAAILYAAYFTDSNVFSSNYRLIDGQDALPVTIAALSIAFKTVAASIIAWSLASNTRLVKYLRQKFFPDSTTTTASELQSIEPSYLPIF